MTRTLMRVGALAAVAIAAAAIILARSGGPAAIDLATEPPTVYATDPFAVGDTFTLGNTFIPQELARPIRITGVKVAHSSGIEQIGTTAFEPHGESIGALAGWPPSKPGIELRDPFADGVVWPDDVQPLIGFRVTQVPAGMRGVTVTWIDGEGVAGERTFDFAVLTCAPDPCEIGGSEATLLRELGLLR